MASMQQNVSTLIATARQFKAIIELAEQIKDIEDWLASKAELEAKVGQLTKELFDKKHEINEALAEAEAAKKETPKIRADQNKIAKEIREKADASAKETIEKAQGKVAEMLAAADELVAKSQADAAVWEKRAEDAKRVLAAAEAKLASTQEAMRKLVESVK